MKKNLVLFFLLFCLCLCFAACEKQLPSGPSETVPAGNNNNAPESKLPSSDSGLKKVLHVSDTPYILPSGNDSNSGGVNVDLRIYAEEAYNSIILFDILGSDAVTGYGENTYKHMPMQDIIQSPDLYHMIHHFDISQEALLEAADTGFYGSQYDKDLLRAMYLPYEDMLAATMNAKGAYLDGKVYNIQTLNELFEEDKEAFSRINLDELVVFQERLEEEGVEYGFNQDMVGFANQYCQTGDMSSTDDDDQLPLSTDEIEAAQQEVLDDIVVDEK
ncbi:MAG: hypothetical protein FWF85_09350 [Clostridiales bacterium]|nr:hypothetical protein [Clostridiales bacterium]